MGDFLTLLLKMILTVVLLPFLAASYLGFREHLVMYPLSYGEYFLWGLASFTVIYLFFYQFWNVHEVAQKMTSGIFKFMQPFDKVIVYLIPIYTFIVVLVYLIASRIVDESSIRPYFLFFVGFTMAMHVILHAQELQEFEKTFIKPAYYFWMVIILLAGIFTTVALMDILVEKWTFVRFCQIVWENAIDLYLATVKKIFFLK
jgi:hypothetical protein